MKLGIAQLNLTVGDIAGNAARLLDAAHAARVAQVARSTAWMDTALDESTREALRTPWVLDVDSTIKPLSSSQRSGLIVCIFTSSSPSLSGELGIPELLQAAANRMKNVECNL